MLKCESFGLLLWILLVWEGKWISFEPFASTLPLHTSNQLDMERISHNVMSNDLHIPCSKGSPCINLSVPMEKVFLGSNLIIASIALL